jgi:hypothetical protein
VNQDTAIGRDYEIVHEYYGILELFAALYTKHNCDFTPCWIENTSLLDGCVAHEDTITLLHN